MSFVLNAVITSEALDRVITITSIESDGAIVDAGTDVALTTDSVVAVSSIEDATISDFDSLEAAGNASDFVVTIGGIELARIVNAVKLPPGSNYVVTLGRIERAGVVNAVSPENPVVAVIMSLPAAVSNVPKLTRPREKSPEARIMSLPSAVFNVPVL